jgi:sulfite exporter TauE/SafE
MNGTEFGYVLAFAAGLAGAFHCLGMCGGLAAGYFAGHGWRHKLAPQASYHGMRILTYMLLGGTGAAAGRVLAQSGLFGKGQGIVMILAGLLIITIGLGLSGALPMWQHKIPDCSALHCRVRRFEQGKASGRYLPALAGAVNGLVPCSLVFSVAVKASATASPVQGALLMLCFGAGTLPTMLLVSSAGAAFGAHARGTLFRLTGPLVIALGGWTLYEGWVFYDIMRGLAS